MLFRSLEIDPTNASLTSALANAEARITEEPTTANPTSGPAGGMDFGAMADMMRNMGGGPDAGGAGGLAAMMNNPMMMQMAQQMMGNGGMERLMQNPAIANMVFYTVFFCVRILVSLDFLPDESCSVRG